jgi:hypothetical protein
MQAGVLCGIFVTLTALSTNLVSLIRFQVEM